MADNLHLELVAADRIVWSGEARIVLTRTVDGEIGIMAHHTPLLAALDAGTVEVRTADDDYWAAAIDGGFISVAHNRVSILSGRVELATEIDRSAAMADLESAEAALSAAGSPAEEDSAEAAVRESRARIAAVDKLTR